MLIERSPNVVVEFKPFTVLIHIQEANDRQILLSLLKKLEFEVKGGGIYFGIIRQLREALQEPV